jgi:hypothetical protein
VAGPIFSRIAEKAARYLDLEPHEEIAKPSRWSELPQPMHPPLTSTLLRRLILSHAAQNSSPRHSPREVIGPLDRVVESIAYDSRRVQRNTLFVALRGEKSDGHNSSIRPSKKARR